MTYIDHRSPREKLQDEYIDRLIDGMDWSTIKQYVWDKLDEELSEFSNEQLIAEVKDTHPNLLENM